MDIFNNITDALNRICKGSACCDLWGGPYDIPDEVATEDAIAEDAYELKPDERWITTKKGHHVVINTKTNEIVFGSKFVMKSIDEAKQEIAEGRFSDASPSVIAMFERVRDNKDAFRKEAAKMLNWGELSKSEKWRRAVDGMKGADLYTARNAVDSLVEKLSPRMFSMIPPARREAVAEQCMGIIGSFLHNFGGSDLPKATVSHVQEAIAKGVPSMKDKWPEFFSDKFYDSVVGFYQRGRQAQEDRARDIRDIVNASEKISTEAEAKELGNRIDEAISKYGDMDALRTAKEKVRAVSEGSQHNVESHNNQITPLKDPVFPSSLDELVELPTPASFAKGYTKPKLLVDRSGKKWVLKDGGSEGHAQAEHETSEVYRKLGILAPASKMYGNQRLAEYIEGTELGEFMRTASPAEKKRVVDELRKNFAADVVLGNHDLIGDDEDNVMIGEDGRVWRVDNGGALGKKGAGDDDPSFSDGWVDDIWTMRGQSPKVNGDNQGIPQNPKLAKYFGSIDTADLLRQAAELPWETAIDHLEDSKFQAPTSQGHGFKSQRSRLTTGRKEVLKQRINEIRALANTSRGIVEDGRYMPSYNDRLVKMAYSLSKTPFRELAGHKSKNGNPMIYDAVESGFVRTPISAQFRSVHTNSNLSNEMLNVKNKSLDSILKETAASNGIDLSRTDDMFSDQGLSTSLGTDANKLKVLELVGMGYSLSQISRGQVPDLADHIKSRVSQSAKDYIRSGGENGADFKEDMDSLMFRKAATMLFFQNSNLPNYDQKTQRLLSVRTESDKVIDNFIKQHKGEVLPAYPRDSHASYSWYQTCTPTNANNLVAVSIPISRITSCDLFSNSKGENLYNKFHRQESEIGANAFGLPFVYLGKVDQLVPITEIMGKIAESERKSGKSLTGMTI